MKLKKMTALLAALLFAIIPLAACGTPGGTDGSTGGVKTAAPTETNAADNGAIDILPVAFKPVNALSDDVGRALSGFSVDLFQRVASADGGKNVFVSPLSVWLALCMTYNGASGATAEGMAEALHAQGIPLDALNADNAGLMGVLTSADPDVRIELANSIWVRKGLEQAFEKDFLSRDQRYYAAKIQALDFNDSGAADIMNKWVEDNTNGNIHNLVEPPIHPMTVMFLINAIHFKAPWKVAFDEKDTREGVFIASDGTESTARYLSREEGNVGFFDENVMAARIPYASGRLEMVALMPVQRQPLADFIKSLTVEKLNGWIAQCGESAMPLLFPKFKVEYELELNDILKAMGMEEAFGDADFTAMSKELGKELFISKVKHKSFVEVDEQGTEASAATSVEMRATGMPTSLEFNRPFVYLIRDTGTGAILFMGTMEKP